MVNMKLTVKEVDGKQQAQLNVAGSVEEIVEIFDLLTDKAKEREAN